MRKGKLGFSLGKAGLMIFYWVSDIDLWSFWITRRFRFERFDKAKVKGFAFGPFTMGHCKL